MMLLVPAPIENRNAVIGAMNVICFGRFSITPAATATIQSIPPAACIIAAEVTTARMMATAAAGGSPGASPKMKTRTNVPSPPQSPTPTPPARVPMTMAPTTTRASRTKLTLMASPSRWWRGGSRGALRVECGRHRGVRRSKVCLRLGDLRAQGLGGVVTGHDERLTHLVDAQPGVGDGRVEATLRHALDLVEGVAHLV